MKIQLRFDSAKRRNMMKINLEKVTNYVRLEDICADKSRVGYRKMDSDYWVWHFEGIRDEVNAEAVYSFLTNRGLIDKSKNYYLGMPDRYTDICYFWIEYSNNDSNNKKKCLLSELFIPRGCIHT